MAARRFVVAVIGGQDAEPADLQDAEEVGRRIAGTGAILVCGGLGGVMEAACRGAKLAGGWTVGILPGPTASEANPHLDLAIVTGLGTARNVVLVRTADAIIAIDGAFGTLTEMAHALEQGKRVVSLRAWDLGKVGVAADRILEARTPEEAVRLALSEAERTAAGLR